MDGNVILSYENTVVSMIVKENRIIAPTAEAARKFRKEVY